MCAPVQIRPDTDAQVKTDTYQGRTCVSARVAGMVWKMKQDAPFYP